MSDPIIVVEELGKQYELGQHGDRRSYKTVRDAMVSGARRLFRSNRGTRSADDRTERFWALNNVSFAIGQGEVVGIIGRNGAGKSTVLKILSRITEPTTGRVRLRGRVGSLLEVGTGFHPELTGRENIYLNGAILGMTRREIERSFDQIVTFAEIAQFLDTPVKRYSSGMYVRLAFAVAAHLEPEILIVDEVLAVGDAHFQKKCLGKLQDMSNSGRTVLFVSHNMAAIKSLTARTIVLSRGCVAFDGPTDQAIQFYVESCSAGSGQGVRNWGSGKNTSVVSAQLLDAQGKPVSNYNPDEPILLEIVLTTDGTAGMSLDAFLLDADRVRIGLSSLTHFEGGMLPAQAGTYSCRLKLRPLPLASGRYFIDIATAVVNSHWDHWVDSAVQFDVPYSNVNGFPWDFRHSYGFGHLALLYDDRIVMTRISDGNAVTNTVKEKAGSEIPALELRVPA